MSLSVYSFLRSGKGPGTYSKYSTDVYETELNWLDSRERTLSQGQNILIINRNTNSQIYTEEYIYFIDRWKLNY